MEKVLVQQSDCNIFDGIFLENENIIKGTVVFSNRKSQKFRSLTSYICNFYSGNGFLSFDDELYDKKTCKIAFELAEAIDKDSVNEVKRLKFKYGETKEFIKARDFLNRKCKQLWDVFENKNVKMNVPYAAMKTLGITNRPSLESLLSDSLKFYEKDNGSTTVDIILSILNNKNLDYTFDDILKFLVTAHRKDKYKFNLKTVSYLASKLDYDRSKLDTIGIGHDILKQIFKSLSFKDKLRFIFASLRSFYV